MKYIKTYEKIDKVKDLRRLFNHLIDVFSEYYAYNTNRFQTNYTVLFYNLKDSNYMFSIEVSGFSGRSIVINRNEIDGMSSYILEYFKTLQGVKIAVDSKNRVICDIIDKNIDNLIVQISNEDFETKYQAYKYNL